MAFINFNTITSTVIPKALNNSNPLDEIRAGIQMHTVTGYKFKELHLHIFDGSVPNNTQECFQYARNSNRLFHIDTNSSNYDYFVEKEEVEGKSPLMDGTMTWFMITSYDQDPTSQNFEDEIGEQRDSSFIAGSIGLPGSGADLELLEVDVLAINYYNFPDFKYEVFLEGLN